ncbi:hypothetical protein GUJ93_ZPchr0012g20822 [Zizania palustris]|uniref:Uncharacterized protein n=1 Tax=Zizania palustris TaxID=103762 RepID=A0A8J5WSV2_ZIZPA|nr:hypothetical protein GUJ93_ZPchr0012g20822 [Zizania palustris]
MINTPTLLGCQREEDTNGLHPCNRSEGIVEVDSLLLNETACHQPSLVLDHHPGLIFLQLEHPLKGDGTVAGRKISQLPCLVPLDGVHLLLHCGTPGRVSFRLSEGTWLTVIVRQMQLCIELMLRHPRNRLLTKDVIHGAVS